MGKILKNINLVFDAIKPKKVVWTLDETGTKYEKREEEFLNHFSPDLPENTKSVEKKKEDPFDAYLTDSGIPWIASKKEKKVNNDISPRLSKAQVEKLKNDVIDLSNDEMKFIKESKKNTKFN